MLPDDEILDLYDWQPGDCFRCARADIDTAAVGAIAPRSGGEHEVRACEPCILAMETARWRAAVRQGEVYEPGRIGS